MRQATSSYKAKEMALQNDKNNIACVYQVALLVQIYEAGVEWYQSVDIVDNL